MKDINQKYIQPQQINLKYVKSHGGDQQELNGSVEYSIDNSQIQGNSVIENQNDTPSKIIHNRNILVQNAQTIIIQNVKSETQICQPSKEIKQQDTNKLQNQQTSQQSSLNLSISSLEIDPNNSKLKEFLYNIVFLILLQIIGPFISSYVLWKYKVLDNLPLKIKVATIIQILSKTTILSIMSWIMIIFLIKGEDLASPQDFLYYKLEFIVNSVGISVATLGGALLGKSALFNNKFFSELYYLSEAKVKKMMNKSTSQSKISNIKTGFFSSLHKTFTKNICTNQTFTASHPLNSQYNDVKLGVFENIQRERKIEERMVKVMKQLFIDSQTFTFILLPFSLENPLQKQIEQEQKNQIQKQHDKLQKSTEKVNQNKQQKVGETQNRFKRLQTIKIQEIQCDENTSQNPTNEQPNDQEINNEQNSLPKINGRKLCNELLIFCEKQESLNPNYFKKTCFISFILLKGFLPCIFRLYDGLNFYGDNVFVGVICQLNRQMIYTIFIGFLLFSIDLDVMNGYTCLTNKLIDYSHYLEDDSAKDNLKKDKKIKHDQVIEQQESQNTKNRQKKIIQDKNLLNPKKENQQEQSSSPKDVKLQIQANQDNLQQNNTCLAQNNNPIPNEQNNLRCQEYFLDSAKDKEQQNKLSSTQEQKLCCKQAENSITKECDCLDKSASYHEQEEIDDIFGQSDLTPSIDFTDIHSLISWNNMRKLGFHYKQKDIILIDRISIVFCLELIIILSIFLLNYFDLLQFGEEYKQTWLILMILLDSVVVIYTQLNRVHLQTEINKSFLSSVKAIMKVQYLLQQSHLIDVQKQILINKFKKKDTNKDDQILQFFLKIKSKMLKQEQIDNNYYNKIMKIVQFIQNDIKHDLENDQLQFLGLIKATPAFEATLFTGVVGLIYWLFRIYMKYSKVDIGLLGQ
ncbi:transmembrane protein, putative (macronuclear) [Tetrahymena thermophila SB210]|uniref:Transmembrane protein, putative n=1 Tax=Tetrahymena thermophila (strain SB210) TaxID=312017 RepID=I7M233_TETTS|nr:transmembrane protein, putative [Tetrahymena thermophila SB210]EAR98393.2 transmembrane protein, putative [Tetrahymena thermophila SB210]|eukprot:XP_001018638.2 transmembrane protein, putative [Tetrahymena thermophila SB210]